jgi:hypothetical protein
MLILPKIQKKLRKQPYCKPYSVKLLEVMAMDEARRKHPNIPDYVLAPRRYRDDSSNELTRAIIDYLRYNGHQVERCAVTGRYLDQSKTVTDTLGFARRIGSGKLIKGSMQPGIVDISATIRGRSIKIEIKMRNKQSPDQKQYQAAIERAGGAYWLVRNFDEFLRFYTEFLKSHDIELLPNSRNSGDLANLDFKP